MTYRTITHSPITKAYGIRYREAQRIYASIQRAYKRKSPRLSEFQINLTDYLSAFDLSDVDDDVLIDIIEEAQESSASRKWHDM